MRPGNHSTLLSTLLLTLQVLKHQRKFSAQFYIAEHTDNLQPSEGYWLSMKYITTDSLVGYWPDALLNDCTAQRWKINSCAN